MMDNQAGQVNTVDLLLKIDEEAEKLLPLVQAVAPKEYAIFRELDKRVRNIRQLATSTKIVADAAKKREDDVRELKDKTPVICGHCGQSNAYKLYERCYSAVCVRCCNVLEEEPKGKTDEQKDETQEESKTESEGKKAVEVEDINLSKESVEAPEGIGPYPVEADVDIANLKKPPSALEALKNKKK